MSQIAAQGLQRKREFKPRNQALPFLSSDPEERRRQTDYAIKAALRAVKLGLTSNFEFAVSRDADGNLCNRPTLRRCLGIVAVVEYGVQELTRFVSMHVPKAILILLKAAGVRTRPQNDRALFEEDPATGTLKRKGSFSSLASIMKPAVDHALKVALRPESNPGNQLLMQLATRISIALDDKEMINRLPQVQGKAQERLVAIQRHLRGQGFTEEQLDEIQSFYERNQKNVRTTAISYLSGAILEWLEDPRTYWHPSNRDIDPARLRASRQSFLSGQTKRPYLADLPKAAAAPKPAPPKPPPPKPPDPPAKIEGIVPPPRSVMAEFWASMGGKPA